MIPKRPLDLRRLRSVPPSGFGWLDHRLLRDGYFQRCTAQALALYSLLVCAGDAQGLSFYGEARLAELLGLDPSELCRARNELIAAELIAFQKPLYQVLALGEALGGHLRPPAARASARPATPPVTKPPAPAAAAAPRAAPGLDLCAMVKARLHEGGAR